MSTSGVRSIAPALLACLLAADAASAQSAIRIGPELQVNSFTLNGQITPAVAASSTGFIVVWVSYGQDGANAGVFGRRFTSSGAALAAEFQVNTLTTGYQLRPAVAASSAGEFVVVWDRDDGSDLGVFGQRFAANGTAIAKEFLVNSYTGKAQYYPSIAMNATGAFVVAWESREQEGGLDGGIFARRFSASGVGQAVEFQVNDQTTNDQTRPTVAINASGEFVIAWQSYQQDGSQQGSFAKLFDSSGVAIDYETRVSTATAEDQARPNVAIGDDGRFVVAWQSFSQVEPGNYSIRARQFNQMSEPLADEIGVNQYGFSNKTRPHVAIDADGAFVISWQSNQQDGDQNAIIARRFTQYGFPQGDEFLVNTYTPVSQQTPSLAAHADGDFVVAWQSGQDGQSASVHAQPFAALVTLDVDGDGDITPLTDGLLVLRFMFGFSGTTLTMNAVGANCTRCDGAAIAAYLGPLT